MAPTYDILQKPPPEDDDKGWYRWFYRICELMNRGPSVVTVKGTYANNTDALAGGLVANDIYRTSTGILMVVY